MPLRKTTLRQLHKMAKKDRRLFEAVLKNPRKAIEAKGMTLSPQELKKLERSLKKVYKISGKHLARAWFKGHIKGGPDEPWIMGFKPWP